MCNKNSKTEIFCFWIYNQSGEPWGSLVLWIIPTQRTKASFRFINDENSKRHSNNESDYHTQVFSKLYSAKWESLEAWPCHPSYRQRYGWKIRSSTPALATKTLSQDNFFKFFITSYHLFVCICVQMCLWVGTHIHHSKQVENNGSSFSPSST